jgi:hypothetical protein
MRRLFILSAVILTLTACASSPPRPQRSESGFRFPRVDARSQQVHHQVTDREGRAAFLQGTHRAGQPRDTGLLEAMAGATCPPISAKGITQVYEKTGNSLQVLIYEGIYYTWVEVSATRTVTASQMR